jgi:hypothetical protein
MVCLDDPPVSVGIFRAGIEEFVLVKYTPELIVIFIIEALLAFHPLFANSVFKLKLLVFELIIISIICIGVVGVTVGVLLTDVVIDGVIVTVGVTEVVIDGVLVMDGVTVTVTVGVGV